MQTVLLVEDQRMNRKLFKDILEMQFQVEMAETAEAALEQLQTLTPNLILLDMQLPGMDGLTLLRHLKADERLAAIPVVGLSAHALPRDVDLARAAGCVDYVTKPVTEDPFVFLQRVARFASGSPGAAAERQDNELRTPPCSSSA